MMIRLRKVGCRDEFSVMPGRITYLDPVGSSPFGRHVLVHCDSGESLRTWETQEAVEEKLEDARVAAMRDMVITGGLPQTDWPAIQKAAEVIQRAGPQAIDGRTGAAGEARPEWPALRNRSDFDSGV